MERSSPSRVAELSFHAAGDGGVEMEIFVHSERALVAHLGPQQVVERSCHAQRLIDSALRDDIGSFWSIGDDAADEGLLEVEALRLVVREWDLRHIVEPALLALGDERTIILCNGHAELPEFSLRQTLQWGLTSGALSPGTLGRAVAMPVWNGPGAEVLLQRALAGDLPRVRADRLIIALQRPPGGLETTLSAHIQRARDPAARAAKLRALLVGNDGPPQSQQVRTALRRWEWTEALVAGLRSRCASLGVTLVEGVSLRVLMEILAAPEPDACLVLLAHQDASGLHLDGGPVALPALAALLADLRSRQPPPWGSVDLGVCGAAGPRNLADIFQSYGVPVVMTSGTWAYFGRLVGCWQNALDLLDRFHEAPSLPELLDAAWASSQ